MLIVSYIQKWFCGQIPQLKVQDSRICQKQQIFKFVFLLRGEQVMCVYRIGSATVLPKQKEAATI